jgi:hypothetical protein
MLSLQGKDGIFSCIYSKEYMAQTSENRILSRIRGTGSGWAFSPRDFLDISERATIDSALHRLAQKGQVRRVIRGVYDYPRFSELLEQELSPDIDQVARTGAQVSLADSTEWGNSTESAWTINSGSSACGLFVRWPNQGLQDR